MVRFKRDVLERQSLSELKMGKGSPICERVRKKIMEYFKNNVPQRQIAKACKSHHLQCITTSKDSEKLEKSLCVRDNDEDLCWMLMVFGPSDDITHFCKCQLKLYHEKRKPYVNMVQKRCGVLWAKAHLKWKVSKWKSALWSDESKFYILVGNHRCRVLRAKEQGDLPACHQCSVQKPASLMVWGCISAYGIGGLHVLEGTMNAESYIKVLEQHMLPSR